MKHHHTEPCSECPWRTASLAGWLGGYPPEYYADAVAAGQVPACHLRDNGPESDETAFCAGALTCMKNQAKLPTGYHPGQENASEAVAATSPSSEVFWHHSQFYEHHAGTPYTHPLMRVAE